MSRLSGLIEALNIFLKYGDILRPTECEKDELMVFVSPASVSKEDIERLNELGFYFDDYEGDCFKSFNYGYRFRGNH